MLKHKLGIIVATKDKHGQAVDNTLVKEDLMLYLSIEYGGASAIEQLGAWVNEAGELMKEENTLVYAYSSEPICTVQAESLAEIVAEKLDQESVLYEIDGQAYFAEQNPHTQAVQAQEKEMAK